MAGRLRIVVIVGAALAVLAGGTPAAAQETPAVSGTVVQAGTRLPLDGVCVEVVDLGDGSVRSATTDLAGRWRVPVPSGVHVVGFNTCAEPLPGWAAEFWRDAPSPAGAEPVVVGSSQRTGVDASLDRAGTIEGTVVDEATTGPIAEICVLAIGLDTGYFVVGRTEASGAYALTTVRPGRSIVFFFDCRDPGLYVAEIYDGLRPATGEGTEPTELIVREGEVIEGVDAALLLGGAITGTALAAHTGQGAPFVCVAAYPVDSELPSVVSLTGLAPSGTPGGFHLAGVPAGEYHVEVHSALCGDDGYRDQWHGGGSARSFADRVRVDAGAETVLGDTTLELLPTISHACGTSSGTRFPDVDPYGVHTPAIECLAGYGITAGRANGSYGPAAPVRRDQMASFVARTLMAAGVDLPGEPPDAFDDDGTSVHEHAINQLAAIDVVRGSAPRRFDPAATVPRGQMTTFLVRAYEHATGTPLRAGRNHFTDDDGHAHEASINKAATAAFTAGQTPTTFNPARVVTRDQMATFLARLLDRAQRDLYHATFTQPRASAAGATTSTSAAALDPRALVRPWYADLVDTGRS
jgi:hypothetical protein